MKNILITAGGTFEPIDGVRGITNFSGGKLGVTIANELSAYSNVFLIRSKNTPLPLDSERVHVITVTDTKSVWEAITDVMSITKIDTVIHAMAVSDYTTQTVMDVEELIDRVVERFDGDSKHMIEDISAIIREPKLWRATTTVSKFSSTVKTPIVYLQPTPKLIMRFKERWPETKLVGFKLLNNVPELELMRVAIESMQKTGADFIVANDLQNIKGESHKAFILDRMGNKYDAFTKTDIALLLRSLIV